MQKRGGRSNELYSPCSISMFLPRRLVFEKEREFSFGTAQVNPLNDLNVPAQKAVFEKEREFSFGTAQVNPDHSNRYIHRYTHSLRIDPLSSWFLR